MLYRQCSSTMLGATLIRAMLWALLINDAAHLIGMEAEDTEGVWFWQAGDWHAEEEEEEDPEGYAYEYEDEDEPEYALDMGRPRQRYAGVKKRPGLQGF